jgi:hypothetical protein
MVLDLHPVSLLANLELFLTQRDGRFFTDGDESISSGALNTIANCKLQPRLKEALQFTPLESPAARSGDKGCSFFSEHGV